MLPLPMKPRREQEQEPQIHHTKLTKFICSGHSHTHRNTETKKYDFYSPGLCVSVMASSTSIFKCPSPSLSWQTMTWHDKGFLCLDMSMPQIFLLFQSLQKPINQETTILGKKKVMQVTAMKSEKRGIGECVVLHCHFCLTTVKYP